MEEQQNSGYDSTQQQSRNTPNENWNQAPPNYTQENKKILAGVLGIVLGSFGIHKFILGYNTEGIILLVIGLSGILTCGITSGISWLIGIIEGIIYLTKSDEEFYQTYQVGKKGWF